MAKKKKIRESTIENYYDLKVDKIDELVAALKGEETVDTEVSMNISDCTGIDDPSNVTRGGKQKQFDPYKHDFLSRIPVWLKALFVKWWFAGCVCWLFVFGINGLNDIDRFVICGAVLGLVTDLFVNPVFRFMETDKREYNAYMMFPFPFKAYWTFFANIVYYVAVMFCVTYCYAGLNMLISSISGTTSDYVHVAVEPLLFGLFAFAVDMIFIGLKDLIVWLVRRSGKKEATADV